MFRAVSICAATLAFARPSYSQELRHEFTNPSFGGNPFNSSHLLGVATAQRPERKRSAEESQQLTEGELFARQIQSRLLSSLSSGLVEAITGADPGATGEFTVGDQTISFERTLTEIRVKITNADTGEVTDIVIPVLNFKNPVTPTSGSSPSLTGGSGSLTSSATPLTTPLQPTELEPKNLIAGGPGL